VSGWSSNGNGWDTASRLNVPANVTIAGQTAPGPVVIMGGSVRPGATNMIVRHVTVAPGYGCRNFDEPESPAMAGDFPDSYVFDAFDISGKQVMLDHVTTVYATDETISMNEQAADVTIQYAIIAQGQNYPQADAEASGTKYTGHALGSLLQAGSNARISVHHNLYAHLKGRLPRVGTEADQLTTAGVGAFNDFRNNVFYNWLGTAGTGASGQASQNNFIGNFYLAGAGGDDASGGSSTAISNASGGTGIFSGSDATLTKVYQTGNVKDVNKDGDTMDAVALTDSDFASSAIQGSAYTQAPYKGMTETAAAAFDRVLSYAGSRHFARAALETRLVAETRAVSGRIVAWADDPFNSSGSEGTEWRALVATPSMARAAGFDSDQDGMPDTWESSHGLNPATADNNGDQDSDGYTNLEEYLNELAAFPAPTAILFLGSESERYASARNFGLAGPRGSVLAEAHWQPSRFDLVRVVAPRAVVDAPGQVAGALEVAGGVAPPVLAMAGGSLDVRARVSVGGVLELGRGALSAGSLELAKSAVVRWPLGSTKVRVSGDVHLDGHLELAAGALRAGESVTLLVAQGDVSGRFASVPPGHTVQIAGGNVLLRSTLAEGPELYCTFGAPPATRSGG
jgi:pectate lyase